MIDALPDFDTLWDFANPAATQSAFVALLDDARAADNTSYLAQLLSQIARAQSLQQKTADAHATLDEAEALLDEADDLTRVRYLLERGRTFNGLPRPYAPDDQDAARARPFFQQAWDLARRIDAPHYAIDAAHMLAIVSPPDTALDWNRKAIAVAETATDAKARRWLGSLYNNTGWTLYDRGDYDEAQALFQKALDFHRQRQEDDKARIARWSLAKCLRVTDQPQQALAIQQELLASYQALDQTDPYVFEELAECLLVLGRTDEARPHFAAAYAELSKDEWFAKTYPDRLARLKQLGETTTAASP